MAAQPVGLRWAFTRDAGVTDKARPVRQGIQARNVARTQLFSQGSPRLLFRRVFFGDLGDMKQYRLAPFLNCEAAEARNIDARGTQELRGHTQRIQIVRVLAEAERDPDFFVADGRQVRW